MRNHLLPGKSFHKVNNIFPEIVNNRRQRIPVRLHIEIEGTPEKMTGAVGQEKLNRRGGVAMYVVKYAVNIIGPVYKHSFVYRIGFYGVPECKLTGVLEIIYKVAFNSSIA